VDLYIHSPIRLHGVVHNYLSTGTTLRIPVTGRGDPQRCERSRLPYFLNNRLTDGGAIQTHEYTCL
jgi:hypothetical protein